MELTRRKRIPNAVSKKTISDGEPCHELQLYMVPPDNTIELSELYKLAVERLKVLRLLEQTIPRVPSKNFDDKKSAIIHELRRQGLKTYAKLMVASGTSDAEATAKERLDDYISHFLLRLTYSQTDNLRLWFLTRELELFRFRFHSLSQQGVNNFLEAYQLNYTPISSEEKNSVMSELISSTANITHAAVEAMDFYKVPFAEVLDLISSRKVYLKGGNAYVPQKDLLSVVSTLFRNNLYNGLKRVAAILIYVEEDERLRPLLNLHNMDFGKNYQPPKIEGIINVEALDPLSRVSFPPCMRQIHEHIRKEHHAKHGARMQYGLFLKAIGVPLEESVRFWQSEFTKKITPEKFQSLYLYSIRHNYGQEGKRTSYSCYSCKKIQNTPVGPGDAHGCPFKHNSQSILKQQLESFGTPLSGIQDIMEFVKQRQHEIACTKYFEYTHPSVPVEIIYHPAQFFELSRKFYGGNDAQIGKKNSSQKKMPQTKNEKVDPGEGTSGNRMQENQSMWASMDVDFAELVDLAEKEEKMECGN